MRKSIRKSASLCLAMAMILSVLAMPVFAEMKAVHRCVYDIYVTHHDEAIPYDGDNHLVERSTYYACDCGAIDAPVITYFYAAHIASRDGQIEHVFSDPVTGATVYYVRYTCAACYDSFILEEYELN